MEYKTIDIHGKSYMPVNERVRMAHNSGQLKSITTEIIQHNPVVIKATILLQFPMTLKEPSFEQTFTGISAANPGKAIEKQSPYEVAETSAVGRALGFAGFGIEEGIASADEMKKATTGIVARQGGSIKPNPKKLVLPEDEPFIS